MAITLSLPVNLGGGRTDYIGTFTHTAGAALETFNLGSARVVSIEVSSQDANAKKELVSFSESVSGSTNTVTVNKLDAVTAGKIIVRAIAGN